MTKTQTKAAQIQRTVNRLKKQLLELYDVNDKMKDSNNTIERSDAWTNDKNISMLLNHANKLNQIDLIK